MPTAMMLHAFSGDGAGCWRNRQPNEIIFTAQRDDGASFHAIVPGAMRVQLLEPASRTLPVTSVRRDGEVFRAQLARFDDEAAVHSGVYLASIFAIAFEAGKEFDGQHWPASASTKTCRRFRGLAAGRRIRALQPKSRRPNRDGKWREGRLAMKMKAAILMLAGATAFGQQPSNEPPSHYARAYYTKWKPGKAQEGQAFLKDVPYKATLNWLKADTAAVGQVTMTRVLPGGSGIAHDRLRLVITTAPPDLSGGGLQPGARQFVEAAGMAGPDYNAKLGSLLESIRIEVWRSEYRYGSIQQGDFVRLERRKVPTRKRAALRGYSLDWEGAMRAQIVKDHGARGLESWTVPLASEEDPFYVSLVVRADSPSIFQGLGGREQIFTKAHPSKDYHAYRQVADAAFEGSVLVESVVYRVDLVAWK